MNQGDQRSWDKMWSPNRGSPILTEENTLTAQSHCPTRKNAGEKTRERAFHPRLLAQPTHQACAVCGRTDLALAVLSQVDPRSAFVAVQATFSPK